MYKRSSSAKKYVVIKSWNLDFLVRNCQILNMLLDSKWHLLSPKDKGLIGRLRRGAIKRFEVQPESRLMRGSNRHHRLSKAGSKVNHERAGYTVVGSKIVLA